MRYTEAPPPAGVSALVSACWSIESTAQDSTTVVGQILPDGQVEIVRSEGATITVGRRDGSPEFALSKESVVGLPLRAWWLKQPPGARLSGVRLRPEAACLIGTPTLLVDKILPAATFPGFEPAEDLVRTVDALLARGVFPAGFSRIRQSIDLLEAERGLSSIERVASTVGVSIRQLQRSFLEVVGASPKSVGRRIRFRHLNQAVMRTAPAGWADVAVEFGFTDQSHLINEFRDLVGATPLEIYPPGWYERHDVDLLN
jgi:AraC-like DNA-binding protein